MAGETSSTSEGVEAITAIRVAYDMVPEWSGIVERISRDLGRVVEIVPEPRDLVIRVQIPADVKPRYIAEMAKAWESFSEARERLGQSVSVKYTRHDQEPR